MLQNKYQTLYKTPLALLYNIALTWIVFTLCRIIFLLANISYFPDLTFTTIVSIFKGGVLFDISAIIYTNLLYILMMAFPLHYKENNKVQKIAKWLFVITNGIAIIANLADVIYFRFTTRRTTASVFSEFSNEGNIGSIILKAAVSNWYLTVLGIILIFGLWKLYRLPQTKNRPSNLILYYISHLVFFLLLMPLCIFGMRGGIGSAVRPITNSNANQYVNRPAEANIVLNTPFSIYRTIGKKVYKDPKYFASSKELDQIFNPVHQTPDSVATKKLNVVVLIVESFSKEFIGTLNPTINGGKYKGYTPFLDSLIKKSLTFTNTFANGHKSIDGMPSVLSSIPMFYEPYFLTHYSLNKVSGIAGELQKEGYYTAFFHGAPNGSMGFEAFARTTGFKDYFGMTEYNNKKDFDGTWAIWDEEFFQFYANKMNTFKQPFATAMFSASSHDPFVVPERYEGKFPKGNMPIHKCVGYTDNALKKFFETASKQPWFKNTLFVITADHTNQPSDPYYKADCGTFAVPIIFYRPDESLKGNVETIVQQIDIMPSVLGYLGYKKPYIAFGRDIFHSKPTDGYTVNFYNNMFQYLKGKYMIQYDGQKTVSVFDFINDPLLKQNLLGKVSEQASMEKELKAIIQQYMERMINDQLTTKKTSR